jgi:hypothetical protein
MVIAEGTRTLVRHTAAILAGLISLIYFLIGFQLLTVLDRPKDQVVFGLIAGSAFLIGALFIEMFDRRLVMGLGAAAQAFIIYTYFDLASQRQPSFEIWGIVIRVIQVALFTALLYLAMRPRTRPAIEKRPVVVGDSNQNVDRQHARR